MQILDIDQYSPEWYQARLGLPTVSEFSRFITPKRGDLSTQAIGYIADLIVESIDGPLVNGSSYWMDRGSMIEPESLDWYAFDTGQPIKRVGLVLNKGAGWSPDALVGSEGAVEAKCPKPSTHVKWLLDGTLPDEHRPQVHGALIVGKREWIDFFSYCPGFQSLRIRVTVNEYTAKVEKALAQFLEQYEAAKIKVLQ